MALESRMVEHTPNIIHIKKYTNSFRNLYWTIASACYYCLSTYRISRSLLIMEITSTVGVYRAEYHVWRTFGNLFGDKCCNDTRCCKGYFSYGTQENYSFSRRLTMYIISTLVGINKYIIKKWYPCSTRDIL